MLLSRRTLLLAPPAAGLAARTAAAAGPMKVGFVYVSPIGDAGWSFQHELGRRAVDAALGSAVKTVYVENVEEGADAERVIRKLASDGNELIFATSFGYMNPTLKVAQQFPKIRFEHATGYKRAANVATYSARFYEGRYVAGMIAARMSKTGIMGDVAAFPIPEVVQGINAFTLGARSVNPKAQVKVVWTSSWFDPGKERAAADVLIAQGADVITHHTDSTAIAQVGEEKGVFTVAYNSDMAKYGPKTCLTAVTHVWGDYYVGRVKAAMAGTWTSGDTWGGFKDGMVKLAPYNAAVPDAVRQEAAAKIAQIADGSLKPFQGPIMDQSGKPKVAAGAAMSDKEIAEMKWFVEGVQGKI
ncbi:BMP family ABC transporter substrate-binding protein [Limobrevibacterium gyesilva]|uniref:BMP family ABC transporter substrate-binding protein n=1 Tax=Limobrevibacterium gyesilva TaxID=2991712 RepID=A0AA42CG89_9PROT|nr:BMP family ABC transporter substrate-binding protein [Limobrevibacterium gyesilva]MCW3473585.1 BMP family ABC transporter substrate-binding protein [Limobrevibacterium gyesilva]